jgi:hypothetical protein
MLHTVCVCMNVVHIYMCVCVCVCMYTFLCGPKHNVCMCVKVQMYNVTQRLKKLHVCILLFYYFAYTCKYSYDLVSDAAHKTGTPEAKKKFYFF